MLVESFGTGHAQVLLAGTWSLSLAVRMAEIDLCMLCELFPPIDLVAAKYTYFGLECNFPTFQIYLVSVGRYPSCIVVCT